MCQLVIFFRSRDTSSVMNDAHEAEILDPGDRVVVVAHKNNELAKSGDVARGWDGGYYVPLTGYTKVIIITNGGSTAQLVPMMFRLGELAEINKTEAAQAWEKNRADTPYIPLEVLDLQLGASPVMLVEGLLDGRYGL